MMPSIHDREIRRLAAPRNEIVLNISVLSVTKIEENLNRSTKKNKCKT